MHIETHPEQGRLAFLPVTFFSITLGLGGWAIATQKIAGLFSLPDWISRTILGLDIFIFLLLTLFYVKKSIVHPDAIRKELSNPIKLSFFPTISIGIILIAIALLEIHTPLSRIIWGIGAVLHLGFTLYILKEWISQEHFEIQHMNPAWFIPVVGNILVPIAGVSHAPADISWFFFAIGIVFWVVLFALVLYRFIFHHPIAEKLVPTLFILVAPPAVGFISYIKLTGALDAFARVLYFFALFLLLLLLTFFNRFRKLNFYLSWWAYSFPIAAFTIASVLMGHLSENTFYIRMATGIWGILSLLVILLIIKTLKAISLRKICVEE